MFGHLIVPVVGVLAFRFVLLNMNYALPILRWHCSIVRNDPSIQQFVWPVGVFLPVLHQEVSLQLWIRDSRIKRLVWPKLKLLTLKVLNKNLKKQLATLERRSSEI